MNILFLHHHHDRHLQRDSCIACVMNLKSPVISAAKAPTWTLAFKETCASSISEQP
jgi:hypothetical protein